MVSIGKILGLLIFFSLSLIVTPKNYDFQVTYECHNNEYKWFEQKLKNETVYGCKNWIQKILIKQKKNEFVRFESAMKEEQEKAEQEQQKDFEEEQKRQEEEQKLLQYQQEEEMLQQIEEMEKQIEEQRQKQRQKQKQREFEKQGQNKQNIEASTAVQNKQSQQNTQTKAQSSSTTTTGERQKLAHRLTPLKSRKLIQNRNDEHLTHRLANIFHNLLSPHSRHRLKSSYDSEEHQNQIRHYFELRHTEEQKQGEEEKFKPIKLHRSHPVEDVIFLLELIQMNSLILESTYPLHDQDIPSLQQLEKRHPKPVLPQGNTSAQQMQHFQAIKSPQYLRTHN